MSRQKLKLLENVYVGWNRLTDNKRTANSCIFQKRIKHPPPGNTKFRGIWFPVALPQTNGCKANLFDSTMLCLSLISSNVWQKTKNIYLETAWCKKGVFCVVSTIWSATNLCISLTWLCNSTYATLGSNFMHRILKNHIQFKDFVYHNTRWCIINGKCQCSFKFLNVIVKPVTK